MTARPVLFHDPTSEPSRAVHWFCLEASIPIDIRPVYLTRGEHLAGDFLAINPRHQVPALSHGDMHLSEATAIMRYLAELHDCESRWLGADAVGRARINQLMSWYHTNLRLKVTLEYFLPVLLAPAYLGAQPPNDGEVAGLRDACRDALQQLDAFIGDSEFLTGDAVALPDLLFAPELFALDADPYRDDFLRPHRRIVSWLDRLRSMPGYASSHSCWNEVAVRMRNILSGRASSCKDPSWVADICERLGK